MPTPKGLKIPPEWIRVAVTAIISALLGTNIYDRATTKTDLTREQARWDSETAEILMRKLDRIEAKLEARP